MLQAGDIVFTEARVWTPVRRVISTMTGGGNTVHVAIAEGATDFVFESVKSGLRRQLLPGQDAYTVYRHRHAWIGELIGAIADGYVKEAKRSGGHYGQYSLMRLLLAIRRTGIGGEREQWGIDRSGGFYCSNFVAQVLMAAQQANGSGVYESTLNTHISPRGLKEFLAGNPYWEPVA